MTLPNKITVSRIIGTPLFYALFVLMTYAQKSDLPYGSLVARIIVVVLVLMWLTMEISDVLDGYLARKHQLVSDMGKLLDPFSDVLSRLTYFFCFVQMGLMPFWPLLIIFWRELSITFIRAVLATAGITLAANKGGKTKAIFYFITSCWGMALMVITLFCGFNVTIGQQGSWLYLISTGLFAVAALASVTSFISYLRLFLATSYAQKFLKEGS